MKPKIESGNFSFLVRGLAWLVIGVNVCHTNVDAIEYYLNIFAPRRQRIRGAPSSVVVSRSPPLPKGLCFVCRSTHPTNQPRRLPLILQTRLSGALRYTRTIWCTSLPQFRVFQHF